MIIVRAPLRISFVGGGSDLPDFYHMSPGKVISATIDKYVYVAINPAPLLKGISARYSINENVKRVIDLKNDRIRETMLHLGVEDNMEIGTFSHMPVGTGLGGSSSFAVTLVKGLSTYLGQRLDKKDIAEIACKIEIDILKEPIGKQDQYAATFGGFNTFQFNSDESVDVEPILLDYKKSLDLENHMLVFFTGILRKASSVLKEQKTNIPQKMDTLKSMVDLVEVFKKKLIRGDFEGLGKLLHENWLKKKKLASNVSNSEIDQIYTVGMRNGAWGGKVLGAGGGGCILFLAPFKKKEIIKEAVHEMAKKLGLSDFKQVPIKFVHSGVEIVSSSLFN
ncbi:hypothetical protein A3A45_00215 [Candidatus Daviesbacteria bacterium RIFCSPLOWO2_01_FULL_36_8]|nr:MAG: hypothetical protein A3A45_00215 [Candidatus Daviesbacteria bacterium RIFCSPLOWO2_01_FULL_36_8]